MKKEYLEAGKIVNTHGIKGEVKIMPYTDIPEILCEFETLYLNKGKTPVKITRAYVHKNVVIIKIDGVDTIEEAQKYIGKMLYMDRNDVELPEDVYFIQDIIGLTVKNAQTGEVYGKITDVYQNGATDVYSIKKENGKELMFPYIDDVVKKIDIEAGEMLIIPLEGLFDED